MPEIISRRDGAIATRKLRGALVVEGLGVVAGCGAHVET